MILLGLALRAPKKSGTIYGESFRQSYALGRLETDLGKCRIRLWMIIVNRHLKRATEPSGEAFTLDLSKLACYQRRSPNDSTAPCKQLVRALLNGKVLTYVAEAIHECLRHRTVIVHYLKGVNQH